MCVITIGRAFGSAASDAHDNPIAAVLPLPDTTRVCRRYWHAAARADTAAIQARLGDDMAEVGFELGAGRGK
jgi:hypothetical protein